MAVYGPTLEREGTLRLRKCPVFYNFALERAVESRIRVLENQLLVTVCGREKEKRYSNKRLYILSLQTFAPFLCPLVDGKFSIDLRRDLVCALKRDTRNP